MRDAKLPQAKFGELIESMPDGIVLTDSRGTIVLANRLAEGIFGYAPGELRGRLVEVLLPPQSRQEHVGHRGAYFRQPHTRPMGAGLELRGMRKDGSEFPVEISLSPLTTEEGSFVVSAVRDISERKRIERALHDKNVELENASRAKDRFLASMSHELRTPLNAIIGFTGMILMQLAGPLTATQEKHLKTIQSSARHLLSLINDLLDLAKVESGKLELKFEAVELGALVKEVAEGLRPLADQKGLGLRIVVPTAPVAIDTDRRALSQIVINLVNNAIKFTEHGEVQVRLGQGPAGEAQLAEISVADTGAGIRPEDAGKLFQAFSQIDDTSTRRYEGTGLGLFLSRKLAHLLGGELTFASRYGEGSVFTLSLGRGAASG